MDTNLISQYVALREKRLLLQREADQIEQQEKDILYELTKPLSFDLESYSGLIEGYHYEFNRKPFPHVKDWGQTLDFIRAHPAAIDLLQKRLTESAVKLRWDAGFTVPGIEKQFKWTPTIKKAA